MRSVVSAATTGASRRHREVRRHAPRQCAEPNARPMHEGSPALPPLLAATVLVVHGALSRSQEPGLTTALAARIRQLNPVAVSRRGTASSYRAPAEDSYPAEACAPYSASASPLPSSPQILCIIFLLGGSLTLEGTCSTTSGEKSQAMEPLLASNASARSTTTRSKT